MFILNGKCTVVNLASYIKTSASYAETIFEIQYLFTNIYQIFVMQLCHPCHSYLKSYSLLMLHEIASLFTDYIIRINICCST